MPRTTVTNTIERIRRQLNSTVRHEVSVLAAPIPATVDSLTLRYALPDGVRPGAILGIGTELLRVVETNVNSREVTVLRGWQDSDAEPHPEGAEVIINPRFTRHAVLEAMIGEIEAWSPDLFQIEFVELTTPETSQNVELPVDYLDAIGIHLVRAKGTGSDDTHWPTVPFKLVRGPSDWSQATPFTGSGLFIRFTGNAGYLASSSLLISVAMPFSSEIDETMDLATLGITGGMLELLELGVKMRLLLDSEIGRSGRHVQDEPRRAEETPPGSAMQTSVSFERRYDRTFSREVRRLRTRYPMMHW